MEQKNTGTSSTYDEIKKLHGLLQEGILTQEEFDKQKTILLNRKETPQQVIVQPAVSAINDNRSSGIRFKQELAKLHTKGTLAIVFAFISPLICWIIGGIGCSQCDQLAIEYPNNVAIREEKSRCVTGIIIGVVVFIIALIVSLILLSEVW